MLLRLGVIILKPLVSLLITTSLLYAGDNTAVSKLIVDSENFELEHETTYGVTNSYAFIVAEHQIQANNHLIFYYGTKVGLIVEDHVSEHGFGPDAQQYGTIMMTNLGIDYKLDLRHKLSMQGLHTQDDLHQQSNSRFNLNYTYWF